MSWFDYAPAALAAVTCLATMLVCFARARRLEQHHARLTADLSAFAEASVRVADTLDALLKGDATPKQAHPSSRRYLLAQAQSAIADGETLEQVSERLHLSHDEAQLLGFAARGRSGQAGVRSTRNWAA